MSDSDDDEVGGYARPPKDTRWPKGKSGNPGGRPKGAQSLKTVIRKSASIRVPSVDADGRPRSHSTVEALVMQLWHEALMQKDPKARGQLLTLIREHLPEDEEAKAVGGPLPLAEEDFKILENHAQLLALIAKVKGGKDGPD